MTPHEQIQEKILSLQTALLSSHPTMPVLLREIHQVIKNDPALVTLMTPDEIAIIVSGLKVQTMTNISVTTAKSSVSKNKALSKVSNDDLGF